MKKLQKLCGFLNFLGRCILPGRAFTKRLYYYCSGNKLKPHYHIKINQEMRSDLLMWEKFLQHPSIYAREFMDFASTLNAVEISMFSDASCNPDLGYRGVVGMSWMYRTWNKDFFIQFKISIAYLELYILVGTVVNWIHHYRNKRIILFCDNQSVMEMVNKTTSSCKNCMVLIRILVLKSLMENVRVFAKYIKSKENVVSDLLSRIQITKFKALRTDWDTYPTPIPKELADMRALWI